MRIEMVRGDIHTQPFKVTEDGDVPARFDNIFFTVKRTPNDRNFLIQKRLSDGGIYETEPGAFQFTILPEDTDGLNYGDYGFDIEFVRNGTLKKTFCGNFVLTKEYTHHYNEGG